VVTVRHSSDGARIGTSGILIAFEGIDGAGKTTQARALYALLRAAGVAAISTKEPTNGKWGAKIRRSAVMGRMPPSEELQAFIEDRKEHVRAEIRPALVAGTVVIVDRYYPSNVAYQGARGMDPAELLRSNSFAPAPDLLFVLDIDPKAGLARVAARGDKADLFEKEDELLKAREIFVNWAHLSAHGDGVHILDATRPQNELTSEIARIVFDRLARPMPSGALHEGNDVVSPEGDANCSSTGADWS
jgi:dTMP kinase